MQAIKLALLTAMCAAVALFCAIAPSRVCFDGAASYTFFCGTSSADCREVKAKNNFSLTKAMLADVCGEAAYYPAEDFDLDGFLSKYGATVLFTEELTDSVNYYCRADLPYCVQLYGQTINLHVCVKDSGVLAASPIIFGGY